METLKQKVLFVKRDMVKRYCKRAEAIKTAGGLQKKLKAKIQKQLDAGRILPTDMPQYIEIATTERSSIDWCAELKKALVAEWAVTLGPVVADAQAEKYINSIIEKDVKVPGVRWDVKNRKANAKKLAQAA